MIETGTFFRVRCVDDTLQRDTLCLGRVYEVTKVYERDGYYELGGGLGRFSTARFEVVPMERQDNDEMTTTSEDTTQADGIL